MIMHCRAAFRNCHGLTSVDLTGVQTIGEYVPHLSISNPGFSSAPFKLVCVTAHLIECVYCNVHRSTPAHRALSTISTIEHIVRDHRHRRVALFITGTIRANGSDLSFVINTSQCSHKCFSSSALHTHDHASQRSVLSMQRLGVCESHGSHET